VAVSTDDPELIALIDKGYEVNGVIRGLLPRSVGFSLVLLEGECVTFFSSIPRHVAIALLREMANKLDGDANVFEGDA
jgi:hypothetical protein